MIIEVRALAQVPLRVAVARVLRMLTAHELDPEAAAALAETEPVLVRAGVAGVTKQVAVHALSPSYHPNRAVIPIRWLATGRSGDLFPTLEANLELRHADQAHTELVLIGSYQPPFGRAGAAIDRLVLHRLAQGTITRFAGRIVQTLEGVAPAQRVTDPVPGFGLGIEAGT